MRFGQKPRISRGFKEHPYSTNNSDRKLLKTLQLFYKALLQAIHSLTSLCVISLVRAKGQITAHTNPSIHQFFTFGVLNYQSAINRAPARTKPNEYSLCCTARCELIQDNVCTEGSLSDFNVCVPQSISQSIGKLIRRVIFFHFRGIGDNSWLHLHNFHIGKHFWFTFGTISRG